MEKINGHKLSREEDTVRVRLVRVKAAALYARALPGDESEHLCVEVTVRSKLRPTSLLVGHIGLDDIKSQGELHKKVEVLAGALAEKIAIRLGDRLIDPDECARLAGKLWQKELQKPKSEIKQA